jgi:hypothetical protein
MSNETRQKDYKNRGMDKETTDKRRKDLNIALRKQKREEQVSVFVGEAVSLILAFQHFKRRNLASADEPETPTSFGISGSDAASSGPTEPVRVTCLLSLAH